MGIVSQNVICYLRMQPLSLSMLSFRFVLTIATLYYTTSIRTVFEVTENSEPGRSDSNKTPRRDHITEVLIDLHWLRIEERIVYKLLILTLRLLLIVLPHCTCVN